MTYDESTTEEKKNYLTSLLFGGRVCLHGREKGKHQTYACQSYEPSKNTTHLVESNIEIVLKNTVAFLFVAIDWGRHWVASGLARIPKERFLPGDEAAL